MALHFIGEFDRAEFLHQYKRIYRFMPINHFLNILETRTYSFRSPLLWNDPYEKYFLCRTYTIDDVEIELPIKNKLFASCFSKTSNSEAFWNVYAPNSDGVRIEFNTEKLIDHFLSKINHADVFVGPMKYLHTRTFPKEGIDTTRLKDSIRKDGSANAQVELMLRKRSAFLYEDEVRVMILPKKVKKDANEIQYPIEFGSVASKVTFDPRFGVNHFNFIKRMLMKEYDIRPSRATLYREVKSDLYHL
jgi:hypothetical protein